MCLSPKLLKFGEIKGVKCLSRKSGGVDFLTNLMSGQVLPAAAGLPEQEQVPHGQDEPGRLDRHHSHHLLHHPRWPREHEDNRTGKESSYID